MDMDFIGFGDNRIQGELLEQGSLDGDGLYVRAVVAGGKVAGANILDSYRISGILKNYMLRLFTGEGGGVPDYQRAMLLQAGLRPEFIDRMEAMTRG